MLQCSKRLLRASLGVSSLNSGRLRAVFFVCGLDRIWPETKPRAYPALAGIQQSPKIPAVTRISDAIASGRIAGAPQKRLDCGCDSSVSKRDRSVAAGFAQTKKCIIRRRHRTGAGALNPCPAVLWSAVAETASPADRSQHTIWRRVGPINRKDPTWKRRFNA
jgi:hypothetical protein